MQLSRGHVDITKRLQGTISAMNDDIEKLLTCRARSNSVVIHCVYIMHVYIYLRSYNIIDPMDYSYMLVCQIVEAVLLCV